MSRLGEKISRLKESEPTTNDEKPSTTTTSEAAPSSSSASFNYREASPIKEAILTKFARLAPNSLTSSSASVAPESKSTSAEPEPIPGACSIPTEPQQQPTPAGPSWIHQVKGRIAKTVEEKVSEYRQGRQEKELRRSVQNVRLFENERDSGGTGSDTFSSLPHSLSESLLIFDSTSNRFEEKDEFDTDSLAAAATTTPSSTPPQGATTLSGATATTSRSEEHSPRERRRFTFPFRERSSKTSIVKNDESTNVTTPTNTPSTTPGNGDSTTTSTTATTTSSVESAPQPINSTPTKSSSLRLRVMGLMGKSPNATPGSTSQRIEPAVSVNMTELRGSPHGEDPFSGVDLGICRSPSSEDFSTSPGSRFNRPNNLGIVPFGGSFTESEVETALEADEALTFDHDEGGGPDASELINDTDSAYSLAANQTYIQRYLQHWWAICIPVCILLLIQILPIPYWMTGFLTGLLVAVPSAIYGTMRFISSLDKSPRTVFVENVTRKKAKRSAIIVQEEIQSKVTWMNLWPIKKGPYDPLSYDVRKTSTVRVMLHGPWLELRFPRANLPLRRMHDDTEPTKIEFHDRVEVIDLSTCSIELLPQNLPSKRVWSREYPIQIRTNTRKPRSSPETSRKMAASSSSDDLQISPSSEQNDVIKANDDSSKSSSRSWSPDDENDEATNNFDEIMFDAKEGLSETETDKNDRKISTTNVRRRKNATTTSSGAAGCDKKISPTNSVKNDDAVSGFVVVPEEEVNKTFYLFSRTSREKEEWFNRLLVAAKFMEDWEHQNPKDPLKVNPEYETQKVKQQKFNIFMEDYFQARTEEDAAKKHEEILATPQMKQCAREELAFFNIYAARLWHDLHDSRVFIDYLRDKLTRKLLKVKIAQYFNDVRVTTLDLGPQLPKVVSASLPWQDELGLWVNLEIEYIGLCQATVETQGIHWPAKDEPDREAQELALSRLAATMDSDEEDSAEEDDEGASPGSGADPGVFDDDDPGFEGIQPHAATGFKARMIDSLLRSEFVAKVAESDWVKKNITGKAITLQLQLHAVRGTLTVNFPPAPSDRVWYGFRTPPELEIALRPCFGGHPLGKYEGWLSTVMKHLEKRLKLEFMKVLVYPNLDDEVLPFMDHVVYSLNAATSILKQNSLSPL